MATVNTFPLDGPSYGAAFVRKMFNAMTGNGYVLGLDNDLAVIAGTGLSVEIQPGAALIEGAIYKVEPGGGNVSLGIAGNSSGNPRIDRVIIRFNITGNTIAAAILQGTPAGSPTAPALTRTTSTYEISLAQVAVANGAVSIITANITDERPTTSVCGIALTRGQFPFKIPGHPITKSPSAGGIYKVIDGGTACPSGKNWVIKGVTFDTTGKSITVNGITLTSSAGTAALSHIEFPFDVIVEPGISVNPTDTNGNFQVLEYPQDTSVTAVHASAATIASTIYTIASGKRLVITHIYAATNSATTIYDSVNGSGKTLWVNPTMYNSVAAAMQRSSGYCSIDFAPMVNTLNSPIIIPGGRNVILGGASNSVSIHGYIETSNDTAA